MSTPSKPRRRRSTAPRAESHEHPSGGVIEVRCDGSAPGGYRETYVPPREPADTQKGNG